MDFNWWKKNKWYKKSISLENWQICSKRLWKHAVVLLKLTTVNRKNVTDVLPVCAINLAASACSWGTLFSWTDRGRWLLIVWSPIIPNSKDRIKVYESLCVDISQKSHTVSCNMFLNIPGSCWQESGKWSWQLTST